MRRRLSLSPYSCVASLCLTLSSVACVKAPQVEVDHLPVKKVVVYRNGVAYFEREGTVQGETVQFQLREENVGDFLATLAILEKGGSSVRAASFPVELDTPGQSGDPQLEAAMNAWEGKKPDKRPGLRKVTLELDGGEHDLKVGYLAETPVWRPSYRLVVGASGTAELQAWGIVQNQSGEDWKDVQISLVAGAPIAFESTLGEPVIPPRPVVTDSGEVIAAVPESETSLHQESPPAPGAQKMADAESSGPAPYMEESREALRESKPKSKRSSYGGGGGSGRSAASADDDGASYGGIASASAPLVSGVGALRDPSRLATTTAQTGSTRYDVPHVVTIPDQSATMVLLSAKTIPGEAVYLFAPDGGVPGSHTHPFRVARFQNDSGGLMEKGPIAIFEKGAFLGQGVVDSLPSRAKSTVPFALVRSLAISSEQRSDVRDLRLYSAAGGYLTIEQDYAQITIYHVQNGEPEDVRLLVRHSRNQQAKLFEPPAGTEEDLAAGVALLPIVIKSYQKGDLTVEERYPVQQGVSFESFEGRRALTAALEGKFLSKEQAELVRKVLSLSEGLADSHDKESALRREQAELEKLTRESRLSLEAIEKNPRAADLRSELTDRLRKGTARLEEITKLLIELGLRRSEQEVRLKQASQTLTIAPPDQRGR